MALNFAHGWRVRVVLNDGTLHEATVDIKCGMKDVGDWFVTLDTGEHLPVREYQMERIPS